ncbi:MAG TPA: tRNA (N(6)-L-threonylcarbamoyladenosine(37)-C(2))-methylthiotransferase MtaB, partial [Gammaproteobacteria bacterium]|nr:tRNA (N(6)-L-threonylcarbamoyladenosine(37)-C(2))-methylthiotransferase MtaB [Gammaproteobacteria bacterium]
MKRRHTRKDAIRMCARLRELRPDIVFGADLIAGFPTETEAMFENTLRLIEECDLTYLHVFPFSPRPGTAAERMPQLPRKIVKQRAARLRSVADAALLRHLSAEVGQSRHVLVEQNGLGRTEYFARTELDFGRPGEIVRVRILEQKENRLIAGMA